MSDERACGRVVAVDGARLNAIFDHRPKRPPIRIGTLVKAMTHFGDVVAMVTDVRSHADAPARETVVADMLGEIVATPSGRAFRRGVSAYPAPGDAVTATAEADLDAIYDEPSPWSINVGALLYDANRSAVVLTDELLNKHFCLLGTTGSGKSCAMSLIVGAILEKYNGAHVVLLDPHGEYAPAFHGRAENVTVDDLNLPLWLLNLEEAANVLVRSGPSDERDSQTIILKDAITWARRQHAGYGPSTTTITVDTPVPYRVHELLRFINDEMGRLGKPDSPIPYLRLRTRIESLREDRRYGFLFGSEEDALAEIVGRLLRIPAAGKPLAIVDLSGVPSEIGDVVVSVLCRIVFDFSMWSQANRMPPLLLICEEAHRYVPADKRLGFEQTSRIITQIAKEGRKYGISLGLISQRPSELAPAALSQCGTVFALRLGSDVDQHFIARTMPDVAAGMLTALPSLPTQQAIVSGEAVRVPMRIRFDDVPESRRPRSEGAQFSSAWLVEAGDDALLHDGIRRWRAQIKGEEARATP